MQLAIGWSIAAYITALIYAEAEDPPNPTGPIVIPWQVKLAWNVLRFPLGFLGEPGGWISGHVNYTFLLAVDQMLMFMNGLLWSVVALSIYHLIVPSVRRYLGKGRIEAG